MTHAYREAAAPLVLAVGVELVDEFELLPIPLKGPPDVIGTAQRKIEIHDERKFSIDRFLPGAQ